VCKCQGCGGFGYKLRTAAVHAPGAPDTWEYQDCHGRTLLPGDSLSEGRYPVHKPGIKPFIWHKPEHYECDGCEGTGRSTEARDAKPLCAACAGAWSNTMVMAGFEATLIGLAASGVTGVVNAVFQTKLPAFKLGFGLGGGWMAWQLWSIWQHERAVSAAATHESSSRDGT